MTPAQRDRAAAQQREAQRQWAEHHRDGSKTLYEAHSVEVTLGDVLITAPFVTALHVTDVRTGPGPDRPWHHGEN